ncbi:hypothetical protein CXB51_022046 [Gossypium anomalum]|uniref:Uncharacterized protein n=1 Tax=Gossypium anomalum TaxID=47600 RepID=A0A8J5Z7E9_9ROSI|nr:hypothetical protein CXB51_022046 [Gossypium anomalum]
MALPFLQSTNQIPNVRAFKVTVEPPSSLVADHMQKRCDQRPGVHGVEELFVEHGTSGRIDWRLRWLKLLGFLPKIP